MSQEYRYKRATMTGNSVLANLDPQEVSNVSNLPQPTGKKPNKRLSMPNRRLSQGRLLNFGQAAISTTNTHKRSSSSLGLQENKRASLGNRNYNRLSIYGGNALLKDPRPLRDKNYQLQLQQEILEFLSNNNLFEIEMKHPLTNKTLKQPTQKDFVLIFQWLYKKIDPGYKFQKTIEQEVYFLLKTIRYPYLESINKSQISAVGGQHWPIFLGMLHWMVQLNLTLNKLDDNEEELDEEEDLAISNDLVDNLFTSYVLKSYKAFLNNEDDYSEYQLQMEQDYQLANKNSLNKIDMLKQKIDQLTQEQESLKLQNDSINSAMDKSQVLKDDTVKFKDYIDKMEQRKTRWDSILKEIKTNIQQQDQTLEQKNEDKKQIYNQLSSLGFTVSDLNNMRQDKDRLTKSLNNCRNKVDNLVKILKEKEIHSSDSYYSLEKIVNSYNSGIYQISNAIDMKDYEVSINLDINSLDMSLLSDEKLGSKPDLIIPELKNNDIRTNMSELKKLIRDNKHQLQDETFKLEEELDLLQESINEKTEELENLESSLSSSKLMYDQLHESFNQESSNSNLEIEKLERDLQVLNFKRQESTTLVNQRFNNVKLEYDTLKQDLNYNRLEIHAKIEKYLEFVLNFKLNIQSKLEDYENKVFDECEKELRNV